MDKIEVSSIVVITIFCIFLALIFPSNVLIFFIFIFGIISFSLVRLVQLRNYDGNLVREPDFSDVKIKTTVKYCYSCHNSYSDDMVFCQNCGTRL